MMNFLISKKQINISIDPKISNDILATLWEGFTFKVSTLNFLNGEEGKISIGNPSFIPLDADDEYTVCIKEDGVGICGRDKNSLIRGFLMFIMCIEQSGPQSCFVRCNDIHGKFNVKTRMVHLCVFPETTYDSIRRQIRLCGMLQYTHIIIEFWGMLKYDCLKELAWPFAFTKEETAVIIDEAKAMGMETIPMFNHLGHASACRIKNGKHVVLDQNLNLSYLFSPDGWAWNINSEEVYALLKSIRKELYDLFGDGEYVHLGCDEAYIFSNGYIGNEELKNYLRKITLEAISEGRKPIIWADMLVSEEEADLTGPRYYCSKVGTEQIEKIRASLPKETIFADWQYDVIEGQIKTSVVLKNRGYKTLVCPWNDVRNIKACINTARDMDLYGVIQTAWHTLSDSMQTLFVAAREMGLPETAWSRYAETRTFTATLLRKVAEPNRSYKECGFTASQVAELNN